MTSDVHKPVQERGVKRVEPNGQRSGQMNRSEFLSRSSGWTVQRPLTADGSSRRYSRVSNKAGRTAVLMESAPDSSPLSTPGHRIEDFVRIGRALRDCGLRAPEIYAAEPLSGFVLMEDFGDVTFHAALTSAAAPEPLYDLAARVLVHLRRHPPEIDDLPDYFASHVHTGRRRIVDWLLPLVRRAPNPDGLVEEYLDIWKNIERTLPPPEVGFVHVDFHVDNLMWIDGAHGTDRCGLLDFQGAIRGPPAYDAANLLGDMRVDVPACVHGPVLARLCEDLSPQEADRFRLWRVVMGAQFHCRMAGQVIRLALVGNKPRYLDYLPHLLEMLRRDLEAPILGPLRAWLTKNGVDLDTPGAINLSNARDFIRPDAF
jgi:aminoglycoside/choline kinase family phosphotransferase